MRVYELMEKLSKFPSGAEVLINGTSTMSADIESVSQDYPDYHVEIKFDDIELIDDDDNSIGFVSEIVAERSASEEDEDE